MSENESIVSQLVAILQEQFMPISIHEAEPDDIRTTEDISKMFQTLFDFPIDQNIVKTALDMAQIQHKLISNKYYWVLRQIA